MSSWTNPVGTSSLSRGFDPGVNHYGLDYQVGVGAAVVAARAGVVTWAGFEPGGYGNLVKIDHGDGYETRYAHLSKITVDRGQDVAQGELIGYTGGAQGDPGAGNSTGPHLHFEIRLNGEPLDPAPILLGAAPTPVLDGSTGAGAGPSGSKAERKATGLAAIAEFFQAIADPDTWRRVGLVLGGSALVALGARILFPDLWPALDVGQALGTARKAAP